MPIRYGTRDEERAHCHDWEAWLLDELASVRAVMAGLDSPSSAPPPVTATTQHGNTACRYVNSPYYQAPQEDETRADH